MSLTLHDSERRQAGRDLHLHVNRAGLDPLKGYGRNALDHADPLPLPRVAEPGEERKNITGTWRDRLTQSEERNWMVQSTRAGIKYWRLPLRPRHLRSNENGLGDCRVKASVIR